MNFKTWLLLTEGVIQIDYDVIKDIHSDYLKYLDDNYDKKRMPKLENKKYYLDLSKTKFSFLQELNPKVKVTIENYPGSCGFYRHIDREGFGLISLDSKKVCISTAHDTIQHEIGHYIQDLFKKYVSKTKNINALVGIPSLRPTLDYMNKEKINFHGKKNVKRTTHGIRPVEFQTNLMTSINRIKSIYLDEIKKQNPNLATNELLKILNDKEKKKEFLIKAISNENNSDYYFRTNAIFKLKNKIPEVYNYYLQEIYKNFVEFNYDENSIDYLFKDFELIKLRNDKLTKEKEQKIKEKEQKIKEKEQKIKELDENIVFGKFTEKDFYSDYKNTFNIRTFIYQNPDYDETWEEKFDSFKLIIADKIKTLRILSKKNPIWPEEEPEYFSFKITYKTIYDTLFKLKEIMQNEDELENKCYIHYFADKFLKNILEILNNQRKKDFKFTENDYKEIFNHFYPPPYPNCVFKNIDEEY